MADSILFHLCLGYSFIGGRNPTTYRRSLANIIAYNHIEWTSTRIEIKRRKFIDCSQFFNEYIYTQLPCDSDTCWNKMVDDPQTWGTSDNIGCKTQTEDKRNKIQKRKLKRWTTRTPPKTENKPRLVSDKKQELLILRQCGEG